MATSRRTSAVPISHRDLTAPTPKAKAFNDPAWVWELKYDGYRALLIKDDQRISLQTRKGNDLLHFFPEIAADLRMLPDIAIDGELVMLDENGKPEFQQLRGRCAIRAPDRIGRAAVSKPAAVFAFDVLKLRGKDLRSLSQLKRKATLQKELQCAKPQRIVYCRHIGERERREAISSLGPARARGRNRQEG